MRTSKIETDKKLLKSLIVDFSVLSEKNKEKVIETTKFLIHAQNTAIPEMLAKKNNAHRSSRRIAVRREKRKGERVEE